MERLIYFELEIHQKQHYNYFMIYVIQKTPDKIELYEVDILESCRGAIIWAEPYNGIAYKYVNIQA